MIDGNISQEVDRETGIGKMQRTVWMFAALHKGASKSKEMCERIIKSIAEVLAIENVKLNSSDEATDFLKKANMN